MLWSLLLWFSFLVAAGATTCSQLKTIYSDTTCCANSNVDTCLRTIPLCTDSGVSNGNICTSSSNTIVIKGGASDYTLPTASTSTLGGVKVDGSSVTISNGVISASSIAYNDLTNKPSLFSGSYADLTNKPTIPSAYTLPTASGSVLGGVKVDGTTVTISNGVISAPLSSSSSSQGSISYTDLTNKPTLFSGSYVDLTNKPTLFDGNYNSLTNKPGGVAVDNTTIKQYDNGTIYVPSSTTSTAVVTKDGQVLEELVGICDGQTVKGISGSYTWPDVTQKMETVSGSWTTLSGSEIAYTPPVGTTQVIYTFNFQVGRSPSAFSVEYRFYIDGNLVTNVSPLDSMAHTHAYGFLTSYRAVIDIGGTTDYANGVVSSWSTSKTLKLQVISSTSTYYGQVQFHQKKHTDDGAGATTATTTTNELVKPVLNIRAIGKESNYYVLPNTLVTLAGVLQVDGPNLGLGISPTAPFHVGGGVNTSISASRFECDGSGAIITQKTGKVSNIMTRDDCSKFSNFEAGAVLPATTATKHSDAVCTSGLSYKVYGHNVIELTSGSPDLSMTENECKAYGKKINNWEEVHSWSNIPTGCFRNGAGMSDNKVRYNTHQNSLQFSTGRVGLQKLTVKESTSGTAANDITERECKGYAGLISLTYESVSTRSTKLSHGDTHIIGGGYTSFTSPSSASTCVTKCAEEGYAYSSYATNSVKCRCAQSDGNVHSYGYGTGVYEITPQPSGCYKDGSKIWHTSLTTTTQCDETRICLSKDTTFKNPGTPNDQHRVNKCRDACSNPSQAIFSGTRTFTPASFTVEPTGGECTCHLDYAATCGTTASDEIDLYNLNWRPKGCFQDSSSGTTTHYWTDVDGGVCSEYFPCLRNDEGCLVQDTNAEVKELSMIVEKSAWFKQEVVISSDRRIKDNIVDVEDARSKMRQIPARSYGYIDKRKWDGATVGFIAQEVKAVMPEAVKVQSGFLPNLLKRIECTYARDETLKMTCPELTSGRVRLFVTDEDGENLLDIDVKNGVMEVEKVYVYTYAFGYEVDDFHTLEKSKLFALNFAATKEMDADVEMLKEQVNDLIGRVKALERL